MSRKHSLVLIITGPCGVGKTTISKLVSENLGFVHINGDDIKNKLFPEIERITRFPDKLEIVKGKILEQTKFNFKEGRSVVVDYVILGMDQIKRYKKFFADSLIIKVLYPDKKMIIQRDASRACWTAGKPSIDDLYAEFDKLRELIGEENYIDNSNETPERTFLNHFSKL